VRVESNQDERPAPPPQLGGAIGRWLGFWLFASAALALVAPCVVLPVKRERDRVRAERDLLARQVVELEATIEQNEQALQAVQVDRSILEHMATRELNLPHSGERRLPVRPREVPLPGKPAPAPTDWWSQVERSPTMSRMPPWLDKPSLEAVFCEPPTREAALLAAGACALLAVLFSVLEPRRRPG
jgi:hypothetical protein